MEPISAAASILGVIGAIASVTSAATTFMRDFKSARKEIVALKKELAALKAILEILADDLHDSASTRASYPDGVVERIVELAANCNRVVNEIGECVRVQGQGPATRLTWATTGRANVERLRGELEAHKSTLSVTLDLVSVIVLRDIKNDTDQIRQDTSTLLQGTGQIQSDVNRILVEISRLQVQLWTVQGNGHYQSNYVLERFLGDLKSDTETVLGAPEELAEWPTDSAMSDQPWSESFVYSHRRSDYLDEAMTSDTQQAPQVRLNEPSQMEFYVESSGVSESADNFGRILNNPTSEEDPGTGGTVSYESSSMSGNPRERREVTGSKNGPALSERQEDPAPITLVDPRGRSYSIPYASCGSYADLLGAIRRCYRLGKCPTYIRKNHYLLTIEPFGNPVIDVSREYCLEPGSRLKLTTLGDQ